MTILSVLQCNTSRIFFTHNEVHFMPFCSLLNFPNTPRSSQDTTLQSSMDFNWLYALLTASVNVMGLQPSSYDSLL